VALWLAVLGPGYPTADASSVVDCASIRREGLRVDLSSQGGETLQVRLRSGEALRFSFEAEPGPFGTLKLVEGAGAPRLLLVGPSGTDTSFTARQGGAFAFRLENGGENAARFMVSCAPAHTTYRADGFAGPNILGSAALPPEAIGDGAYEELNLDESIAEATSTRSPLTAPVGSGATIAAPAGAQMKLGWLDRRYQSSGRDGPQIDPAASGVEIGINYKLQSAVTVGALAQVNPAADVPFGAAHSLADQGWMAGPVTKIELAPGLRLDARAAWGEGESGPEETVAAAAQRRLLSARLANEQAFGAWRLTPSVNFNYLQEMPHGFVPVPEAATAHATGAGRIDVGPELAYRMDLPSAAFIEPRAVVGGFWDFDSLSKVAPSVAAHSEMRLKAEAGVTLGVRDGAKLQASGALEAGDRETPDAWSGRLQLSVPLK
jgi:hypothetical protein